MADLFADVDISLPEVPVNKAPLVDDTDFTTIEGAVAYNAAGMALRWHFFTTTGTYTVTSVTPTTSSGIHDWADQGDSGIYTIEIPYSGGTVNNDTEGVGWFTGVAAGILPWTGPTILFRAAGINNLLIDDAHSPTRGLAGTALPAAVADAAGGLPISDAGGLDIDALATAAALATVDANVDAILLDTAEIGAAGAGLTALATQASVDTVDANVDAILVDTAEIGTAGAGLTDLGGMSTGMKEEVNTEVDSGLSDIGLDHLVSTSVTGSDVTDNSIIAYMVSKSGTADWDSFDNTSDALEAIADGGGGGGSSAAVIADAVLDELLSGHTVAGSLGKTLSDILTDTGTSLPNAIGNLNDLSATEVEDAVWDAATADHGTSATFGVQCSDDIDAILVDTGTDIPAAFTSLNDVTVDEIVDGVWDEAQSNHTTTDSFGYYLDSAISGVSTGGVTAAEIADAVWDEDITEHTTTDTAGLYISNILDDTDELVSDDIPSTLSGIPTAGQNANAVWDEATSGHTTSGTFGEQCSTDIDAILTGTDTTIPATISALNDVTAAEIADAVWDEATADHTTSTSFGYQTTTLADILSDTSELQTDNIIGAVNSLNDVSVSDIWSESQSGYTTSGTFGYYVDSQVSAAGGSSLTTAAIADAVWDEPKSGHTTGGTYGFYLDSSISSIATGSSSNLLNSTSINQVTSQQVFTLSGGSSDDDTYNGMTLIAESQSDSDQKSVVRITDYVGSSLQVTLAENPSYTVISGDSIKIIATADHISQVDTTTNNTDMLTETQVYNQVIGGLTAYPVPTETYLDDVISAGSTLTSADVQTAAGAALVDYHLDHLFATTYDVTNQPGVSGGLWNTIVSASTDAVTPAFTSTVLEQAISAAGGWSTDDQEQIRYQLGIDGDQTQPTSATAYLIPEIVDQVWDEATANHTTTGTMGEQQGMTDQTTPRAF